MGEILLDVIIIMHTQWLRPAEKRLSTNHEVGKEKIEGENKNIVLKKRSSKSLYKKEKKNKCC